LPKDKKKSGTGGLVRTLSTKNLAMKKNQTPERKLHNAAQNNTNASPAAPCNAIYVE
jgi:hypothetical protein